VLLGDELGLGPVPGNDGDQPRILGGGGERGQDRGTGDGPQADHRVTDLFRHPRTLGWRVHRRGGASQGPCRSRRGGEEGRGHTSCGGSPPAGRYISGLVTASSCDKQKDRMIVKGGITEVVGPPSSGRTSLLVSWLGAVTRAGAAAALVDADQAFDPASAARA